MTNHCPVCRRTYDFTTDGNGRLVALHPIGRCIPFVEPVYEPGEDEEEVNPRRPDGKVRRGYMAEPEELRSCSDVCSERRNRAKQREHWRRSYQRRKAA